ncbi:MAG: carboxylating nicotinate-nucleotide diphosphorylase [Myxococcales bacterium]|nr:carboxylating nicotinate-nucleotide diphosphorylase [Myxococcales bacterium]
MDAAPVFPAARTWRPLLELALSEDIGSGDVTGAVVLGRDDPGRSVVEARQDLVVCGLELVEAVFRAVDPTLVIRCLTRDGQLATPGEPLVEVSGRLVSILAAERTALNFLGRTSGIATHTRRFVNAVAGTGARIVDTRKTLPGWRSLDKYATAIGGGVNHRMGLYDGILLKDNHVAAAGGVELAVKNALSRAPAALRVQVEVENLEQARAAVEAGADFLLLDNMSPRAMREVVDEFAHRAILEATGGVGLENVREIADTGVHRISIGALTHSAPSADVALELADDSAESDGGSAPWGVPR